MRLSKSIRLKSVFIAAMIAAALILAGASGPRTADPHSIVGSIAREILIQPAYAKKKNRGNNKNYEGHKKGGGSFEARSDSGSRPSNSSNAGSSNAGSSKGGANPVSLSGNDKPKDRDTGSGKSNIAKKDPAKNDKSKDKNGTADNEDDSDPEAPAATLDKLFKNLATPAAPKRRTPRIEDFNPGISNPEERSSEILATGMDAAGLEKVKALGFKSIETSNGPGGKTVTKLVAPGYMSRSAAYSRLRHETIGGIEENHTYVIYAPMTDKESVRPDVTPESGLRTGQCREDRCIGRAAICWSGDTAKRASRIKIGIIDTPIDRDHPAFAGRNIKIGSFLGNYTRSASDWHGTAVLALLSGSLESGVPGLAPDAEYYVAETFRTNEQGVATTDSASILKALAWLESQNVTLINMSFSGPKDGLVEQAVQRMRANGFTFVAAAGNFGPTATPSYPAAYKEVIAVTAITKDGTIYPGANRGDYIDLAAPGVKIWTALPDGKEGFRTGTSFAAPFVTGVLAASLNPDKAGKAEVEDLRAVKTIDLGPPGIDQIYGRGLAIASSGCGTGYARAPEPTRTSAQETGALPSGLGANAPSFGVMTVVPASAPGE